MERVVERVDALIPAQPRALRVCAYARVSTGKDAMLHSLSAQVSYFGCFGRLFMVSRSVCVKGILFSNTGSVYGFISSAVPHEAFCQVLF